jgi:MFS transporter, DHA1 family, multidrug resistance protein
MNSLDRFLSRPTAKPYRSDKIDPDQEVHFNKDGHLDFEEGDVENPKNWSVGRRIYITVVAVSMVVNATFASSAPSGVLVGISEYFHVSEEAAGLVITLFLLGYCAGPLIFAPLSEFFGRRYLFYITFLCYIAFNFLCAFAPNFGSLLVGRLLTGTFASAPLTNAPGVVADIWGPNERANAIALFSMMTFVGPAAGPIVAGFLQVTKGDDGWRWIFYVLNMFGGGTAILMFTLPETYAPVVLLNKAKRLRRVNPEKYGDVTAPAEAHGRNLGAMFRVALLRPWQILFDPIALLVAIYISVVYTLLYMLFSIYPIVFQQKRGWNAGVGELPLAGTVVGAVIGGMIVLTFTRHEHKRQAKGHKFEAEDRLPLAMLGGLLFPVTMFWFAWTAEYNSIHWIVPTIAGTLLSTSIMLVFVAYLNYLTDTYLMYTASAMAANTITRSACGAAAPLFTNYMFNALGVGGGGSLIGGVAVLLAPIPFVFYKYGRAIRIKSRFAPTEDKAPQQEQDSSDDSEATEVGEGNDDEEKQQGRAKRESGQSGASSEDSDSDEESLEQGQDYETTEEIERRARQRRERQRAEMERVKTRSDAGD